ncbi:ABC transporter ATP-binding protein [uncultured Ruminococcus sp.]|uniref:ABC transporter ATP-binding protein n=1 Tax=uncultured Ruminococcus sp. TaxID=165186 RepID=UPI0025E4FA09|nr:ABC transporter ATP-binding protein [uncultured Ruminococcus sp.]
MNMLKINKLSKSFREKRAVDGLSFSVEKGEVFALLGSNGAGKTTTIKMILGLMAPDSGDIELSEDIKVGYSPDTPYFPPFLTGRETLEYYGAVSGMKKDERRRQAGELLETVGLEDSRTKVSKYSKGMTQRLAIAQSLLGDPDMLILDEPTAGLDAMGRIEMIQLIGRLKKAGKTIILNSHILSDIEQVCDRGIIMKNGTVMTEWERNADNGGRSLQEIFIETIGGIE